MNTWNQFFQGMLGLTKPVCEIGDTFIGMFVNGVIRGKEIMNLLIFFNFMLGMKNHKHT